MDETVTVPRPYANWLGELRGLFPIPDEFLLADAIYTFSDRFHDGMTPQEAYDSFDEWANSDD